MSGLRPLWLVFLLLLAGCGTPPASTDNAFRLSVLANQAWFVLQQHQEQVPIVRAAPGKPLTGPMWQEFNRMLAAVASEAERAALQAEALQLVLTRVP